MTRRVIITQLVYETNRNTHESITLVNTRNYFFVRKGITKQRGKIFQRQRSTWRLKEKKKKVLLESVLLVFPKPRTFTWGRSTFVLGPRVWLVGGGTSRPETASGGISQASGELMARYCGASLWSDRERRCSSKWQETEPRHRCP